MALSKSECPYNLCIENRVKDLFPTYEEELIMPRVPCIAGRQPTLCHRPCPGIDMLCVVCHQAQSEATRVRVHTTHSGARYSYAICVPSDGHSPLGLVPNLWVPCHIPCVNCPNQRHGKCEICCLYLNQT
ncbi:hypothetical protein TSAR_014396 [Trichomalopsis sarcophagae]|uniref:Uncharacterized protein n=1 Tax=Trichomalopsis sarcophagae TaxID=543379 RepID=A0A232EFG5_9HYME|nr:hypothetical protein TSAR_014396 [Trichomalopsis sarcophagae]